MLSVKMLSHISQQILLFFFFISQNSNAHSPPRDRIKQQSCLHRWWFLSHRLSYTFVLYVWESCSLLISVIKTSLHVKEEKELSNVTQWEERPNTHKTKMPIVDFNIYKFNIILVEFQKSNFSFFLKCLFIFFSVFFFLSSSRSSSPIAFLWLKLLYLFDLVVLFAILCLISDHID